LSTRNEAEPREEPSLQGNLDPKSMRLSSQENPSKKERSHAKHYENGLS